MTKLCLSLTLLITISALVGGMALYARYLAQGHGNPSAIYLTEPFQMVNQDNEPVTEKTFLGKPSLFFFGYTHCPDTCPTTLGRLSAWLHQLGPAAQNLNVVFVTVDPERDTPDVMKNYLSAFSPQITGLIGSPQQLRNLAKEYMVYYAKGPEENGSYSMNHSAMIIMVGPNGAFKGAISQSDSDAAALSKINALLERYEQATE